MAAPVPDLMEEFPIVTDDHLENVGPLAEGGFAVTSLARDGRGQLVVVKRLRRSGDPELVRRFAREARILTRLDTPTIVRVLQKGRRAGDDTLFFVMEHVPGVPLSELVRGARLDEQLSQVGMLADVAAALEHAHARGIVHRDIKPANVIARDDGGAVVIDWGLAADASDRGGDRSGLSGDLRGDFTRGGAGTPFFMSPEQAAGESPAAAMDVYSLGATLYQVLSGAPPYVAMMPSGGTVEDFYALLTLRAPLDIRASVPPGLREAADLAMRCLARAPAARPPVAEVARLLRVAGDRGVCARCGRVAERGGGSPSRDGGWVCGACHLLGAFDDLEGTSVAPPARRAPAPRPVRAAAIAAPASAAAVRLDPSAIVGLAPVDQWLGIRSSAGRDDLGRSVRVDVAIAETADARLRAGREMLVAAATPAMPRVIRAGDLDGRPAIVREDVSGTTLRRALDGELTAARRLELLEGAAALCQGVARIHAAGFAHRRLTLDDLVVAEREGAPTAVAVEWRDVVRVETPGSPWEARPDPDKRADVRALAEVVEAILRGHQPIEGLGAIAKVSAAIRTAHAPSPTDLARLIETLDPLIRRVACVACGTRVRAKAATLGGRGYWCIPCARQTVSTPGADVDLHFTEVEQHGLYRGHRSRLFASLGGVALCIVGLVGMAAAGVEGGAGGYVVMALIGSAASAVWYASQMRRFRWRLDAPAPPASPRAVAVSRPPPPPPAAAPDAFAATEAPAPDALAVTEAGDDRHVAD